MVRLALDDVKITGLLRELRNSVAVCLDLDTGYGSSSHRIGSDQLDSVQLGLSSERSVQSPACIVATIKTAQFISQP